MRALDLPWISLQSDIWTSSNHISYVCLMGSWFTVALDGTMKLEHAVLAFEEFPDESHTGKNIARWLKTTMALFDIENRDVILFSPDGARYIFV